MTNAKVGLSLLKEVLLAVLIGVLFISSVVALSCSVIETRLARRETSKPAPPLDKIPATTSGRPPVTVEDIPNLTDCAEDKYYYSDGTFQCKYRYYDGDKVSVANWRDCGSEAVQDHINLLRTPLVNANGELRRSLELRFKPTGKAVCFSNLKPPAKSSTVQ